MGRIKTKGIKDLAQELIRQHGDKFTDNFQTNKEIVKELQIVRSKKIRNILAGYITRRIVIAKTQGF